MKKVLAIFIAFVALTSCSEAQEENGDSGVINKVVAAAEFNKMIQEDVQLIDVRTPGEYSQGKIGEAVNIDFYGTSFEAEIKKLDKTKKTLVYCASGGRSGKTAKMMKDLGFKEVYDLKGGYGNWPFK